MSKLLSKNISIDDDADVAIIYGTAISGELLRAIGEPTRPGEWFRIVEKSPDGISTVEWKQEKPVNG
jgi:hypothetical protein